tara:strand:- start:2841 stop:3713 length:873 start_codon:yes stop_codon:yes gene_type:complete
MTLRRSSILLLALVVCVSRGSAAEIRRTTVLNLHSTEVYIAAHRGGYETDLADRAPENSVANIQNCQAKGYQLYETDIQRTKDGQFVMVHDSTIDRETTGTGKVAEMEWAELKQYRKKYRDGTVSEERVATLEEFLTEGKNRTIFKADLKPGVSAHFEELMQLVAKHNARKGILFRVPYQEADLFAQYQANGAPGLGELLMFKTHSKKQIDDIVARFNPTTVQVHVTKSNPADPKTLELIRYATSLGMLVETHAEGTHDDWAKLVDAGVRMFHTNKPSKVKEFLQSNRTW